MELKEIISELADAVGVSGDEKSAAEAALNMLKNYTDDAYIKNGSAIGNFGERCEKRPHILLDAHIDQIGMIVTFITDDGFIKVSNIGGLDRRLLPAQQVYIYGKQTIPGIVCSVPPHLAGKGEQKVPEMNDIAIDTGYSKKELMKIVSLGDRIGFSTKCAQLLDSRLTGSSLDDRCGVAALLYMLELIKDDELKCSYTVLFSTQEEVGERGAQIACYDINPDIAIAVDVGFGLTADDSPHKCGIIGRGAMVGISPSLCREVSESLMETARAKNVPYQVEIMGGLTGTNADKFSVSRCGVKTCTCSIPLKYMHTPVEVIDIEDVKNTALLLAEYLRGCR